MPYPFVSEPALRRSGAAESSSKKRRMAWAATKRFAEGNGVDRERNYYIPPDGDAQELIDGLSNGEYVVLYGARQTGKTSLAFYSIEILASRGFTCIYIDFPAQSSTLSSLDDFWKLFTQRVYESSGDALPAPDFSGVDSEAYLRRLLAGGDKDIILVVDEANHLSRIPNTYKVSFLNNLRHLKQLGRSRLLSLLFVGTASLLDDLMIANKYRTWLDIKPSFSGNVYSPFSTDSLYTSKNFTEEEVWELISQFVAYKKVEVERDVSNSIFRITGGRKGLVGVCCALLAGDKSMRDFGHRNLGMWSNFKKVHLIENVFARPTYNAMWENCYALEGDEKQLLLNMLQKGGKLELQWEDPHLLGTVNFLVAEGILVDSSDRGGFSVLHFSSELLHSLLLKQICIEENDLLVKTGPLPFNRLWVIQRTIMLLDLDIFLQEESCNADGNASEYGLQFEFFVKLKKVLELGYPYLKWKVIPEATHEENWRRRLDILAKDGDIGWFGFEILRQGSMDDLIEHYNRAKWYADVHSCVVYMINFVLEGEGVEFKGEPGGPVTVYNVYIRGTEANMVGGWYADAGHLDVNLHLANVRSTLTWD
ncbi:uncharacterized protein LOC112343062 [Selaginella moellendorffii]|uniref:uncharacterized protein LOC112343062 n=1 Tax=Selaginella moellendorffii TaxID=88036 RepID=UPI000D1CCA31|nr:uncharacterized protein LOC112343062 [Selaginella moellendorffii]|eukprot:XP_024521695.1 uncharacterized protein LOC112343062 [Selaginella moellendorffii]